MGMACPVLQHPSSFNEACRMAHDKLDQWFENFRPLFEQGTPPTIRELSSSMTQTRGQLMGGIMQGILERVYQRYRVQSHANCPQCDRQLACKRIDEKQMLTLQGPMTLERPYFYCPSCGLGFHPLDEFFELAREFHQHDIQQMLTKMSAHMPHELAAQLVSEMTGVKVSAHSSHEFSNRVSQAATLEAVLPDPDVIEQKIEQAKSSCKQLPVLVVSIDGAHVPIRPKAGRKEKRGKGHWREAKGFRMYLLDDGGRIINLMSWHQITDDVEDFREDFLKAAKLIPPQKTKVALIADGAEWIWKTFEEAFPDGTQVLDYYHCSEHVHKAARNHFGETVEAAQWAEAMLTRIWLNQAESVIEELKGIESVSAQDEEVIEKLTNYLENHSKRLNYKNRKEDGIPIGSGAIESANKYICHTRLKRPGAWWIKENGNQMLRLRCAIYNDTYEKVFENYVKCKYENL